MQIIKNSFWNSEVLLVSCSRKKLVVKDYNEGSYQINHCRCLSLYIEELKKSKYHIHYVIRYEEEYSLLEKKKNSLSR